MLSPLTHPLQYTAHFPTYQSTAKVPSNKEYACELDDSTTTYIPFVYIYPFFVVFKCKKRKSRICLESDWNVFCHNPSKLILLHLSQMHPLDVNAWILYSIPSQKSTLAIQLHANCMLVQWQHESCQVVYKSSKGITSDLCT